MSTEFRAIRNHIIFQFVEQTGGGKFFETSKGGIIVGYNDLEQSKRARWGRVVKVGHEVTDQIKEGDYIYIEPLAWSFSFKIGDEEYWRTDDSKVLLIADEPGASF